MQRTAIAASQQALFSAGDDLPAKGELIKKYILSLVYEDEVPDVVSQAINDLVQAAQQSVQADTRHAPDGKVAPDEVIPF